MVRGRRIEREAVQRSVLARAAFGRAVALDHHVLILELADIHQRAVVVDDFAVEVSHEPYALALVARVWPLASARNARARLASTAGRQMTVPSGITAFFGMITIPSRM